MEIKDKINTEIDKKEKDHAYKKFKKYQEIYIKKD